MLSTPQRTQHIMQPACFCATGPEQSQSPSTLPFHRVAANRVTVSCSALIVQLPGWSGHVLLAPLAVVQYWAHAELLGRADTVASLSQLLNDVQLTAGITGSAKSANGGPSTRTACMNTLDWFETQPVQILRLKGACSQLEDILSQLQGQGSGSWSLGWSLASSPPPRCTHADSALACTFVLCSLQHLPMAHIVPGRALQAPQPLVQLGHSPFSSPPPCHLEPWPQCEPLQLSRSSHATMVPGTAITAVGAPFGALSPHLFTSFTSHGVISMVWPQGCPDAAQFAACMSASAEAACSHVRHRNGPLMLLDLKIFPGMEGSPLYAAGISGNSRQATQCSMDARTADGKEADAAIPCMQQHSSQLLLQPLVGLLLPPLCRRSDGIELPLAVSWACVLQGLIQLPPAHSMLQQPLVLQMQPVSAALPVQLKHAGDLAASPASSSLSGCTASHSTPALIVPSTLVGPPPCALAAVVQLQLHGTYASGVLISPKGLLLTTKHALTTAPVHEPQGGAMQKPRAASAQLAAPVCRVRLPSSVLVNSTAGSSSSGVDGHIWCPARVVYVFSNHLDLAVVQLQPPGALLSSLPTITHPALSLSLTLPAASAAYVPSSSSITAHASCSGQDSWLCSTDSDGMVVYGVGHGLFGPSFGWPASVHRGNVAKVLYGSRGLPVMLLATPATHAGASGGALLDASGRLAGLITSNTKHASGTTLPHLAFAIPAAELAPILAWAASQEQAYVQHAPGRQQQQQQGGLDGAVAWGHAPLDVSGLRALDVEDEDADRLWQLREPRGAHGLTAALALQKQRQHMRVQQAAGPASKL